MSPDLQGHDSSGHGKVWDGDDSIVKTCFRLLDSKAGSCGSIVELHYVLLGTGGSSRVCSSLRDSDCAILELVLLVSRGLDHVM